jgi:excisionase family DNA binding protein
MVPAYVGVHYAWKDIIMDEILTASQVAELLQLHPRTVYKLVKQGSIPGKKFGGGWRFNRNEIIGLISATDRLATPKVTEER